MVKLNKAQSKKLANFQYMSTKIRYLRSLGYSRVEIKNELKIIYQWVRNVLDQKVKQAKETF